MNYFLALIIAISALHSAYAEDVVVLGKLVYNEPMKDAPDECPKDYICMRSWWKSIVAVQKTIHGINLSGRITAVQMQHTVMSAQFRKSLRLFVLRSIDEPEKRAKFHADFYLVNMISLHQMYCTWQDPKELQLGVNETYTAGSDEYKSYCFELPQEESK